MPLANRPLDESFFSCSAAALARGSWGSPPMDSRYCLPGDVALEIDEAQGVQEPGRGGHLALGKRSEGGRELPPGRLPLALAVVGLAQVVDRHVDEGPPGSALRTLEALLAARS